MTFQKVGSYPNTQVVQVPLYPLHSPLHPLQSEEGPCLEVVTNG